MSMLILLALTVIAVTLILIYREAKIANHLAQQAITQRDVR